MKRGRAKNMGGPQRQNYDGMTAKEKEDAEKAYKSARKKWNDANLAKRARLKRLSEKNDEESDSGDDMIEYTGVSATGGTQLGCILDSLWQQVEG